MILRIVCGVLGMNPYVLYKITPTRLDGISLGCAIAAAIGIPAAIRWLAKIWRTAAWLSLATLAGCVAAPKISLFVWNVNAQMISIPAVSVLTAAVIFAISQHILHSSLTAVLSSRILIYLGRRSYALYLIHEPIRYGLIKLLNQSILHLSGIQRTSVPVAISFFGILISIGLAEISCDWLSCRRRDQNRY